MAGIDLTNALDTVGVTRPHGIQPLDYQPITPSDGTDLVYVARGIKCNGAAGNIVVQMALGLADRTLAIEAGETIWGIFTRVKATGTTATTLVAII